VGITTGAVQFLRSEDELAWVVAHEIAHNVLNHSQDARLRAMLDTFVGATMGAPAEASAPLPRRSLEAQADYVGAYIMARAGFDVLAIKRFWHRMERLSSGEKNSKIDLTHPTTAERLAAFEVTLKEIKERLTRGESLQPPLEHPR
jgi:predicted Zn-dependent protease